MSILLFLNLFSLLNFCLSESDNIIVDTEQGPVRGFKSEDGSMYQFYGIPYAKAPTGEDRFKGPLPPSVRTRVLNASNKYVACPQHNSNQITDKNILKLDCLHINIFMPNSKTDGTKFPVIMYVHGGRFHQGFGNEIDPGNLVARGVIVTNINYRLNVYGFLCLGTEFAPGNAGLKDQVAALRWIKKNIGNFGGDNENVSIVGNSSGGCSVELLMLSKLSAGLFNKAITESGSALMSAVIPDPLLIAEKYANQFGFYTSQNVTALETFYKNLTFDQLNIGFKSNRADIVGFGPCIEKEIEEVERFLHDFPINIIKSGNYNKVDCITGLSSMEGLLYQDYYDAYKHTMAQNFSLVLPIDLVFRNKKEMDEAANKVREFYFPNGLIDYKNYFDFWTDSSFLYAIIKSARLHSQNLRVYLYLFTFNGTLRLQYPLKPEVEGPNHVTQALYVQKFFFAVGYDHMTADDYLIQDRMTTLWYNFIKSGDPVIEQTEVLPVKWCTLGNDECYLNIDLEMDTKHFIYPERVALWQEIYDKYALYNNRDCYERSHCVSSGYD